MRYASTFSTSPAQKSSLGEQLDKFATTLRADYRFAPLNALLLVAIFVIGLVVHLSLYSFNPTAVLLFMGSALALTVILRLSQVWESVVILGTADMLLCYLQLRPDSEVLLISVLLAVLLRPRYRSPTSGNAP